MARGPILLLRIGGGSPRNGDYSSFLSPWPSGLSPLRTKLSSNQRRDAAGTLPPTHGRVDIKTCLAALGLAGAQKLVTEAVTQDHFDQQVIGARGGADADAEVELPLGREVQIESGDDLLLLVAQGVKSG